MENVSSEIMTEQEVDREERCTSPLPSSGSTSGRDLLDLLAGNIDEEISAALDGGMEAMVDTVGDSHALCSGVCWKRSAAL